MTFDRLLDLQHNTAAIKFSRGLYTAAVRAMLTAGSVLRVRVRVRVLTAGLYIGLYTAAVRAVLTAGSVLAIMNKNSTKSITPKSQPVRLCTQHC